MKLAAVQFKARSTWQQSAKDLTTMLLRARGAELIVCPECALTGYAFRSTAQARMQAEPLEGRTFQHLSPIARELGAWVVVGIPELDGEQVYNTALVIDAHGALRCGYRKTLLFEADLCWATAGSGAYPLLHINDWTFTVGICMDLNDDRFLAWCARVQVDVIAFPANWEQEHGSVWAYWRMRLLGGWPLEFGVPNGIPERAPVHALLVGANSYGVEGDYRLRGQSALLTHHSLLQTAPAEGDAVLRLDQEVECSPTS